jgi:hypothetical protein
LELVLDNPAGVASRGRDQSAGYARRRRPSRDRGRGFNSRRLHWLQRVRNPLDFAPLQVFNEAKLRSVRTTECRNLRAAAERRGRNSAADRAGVGHNGCTALASSGPQGATERGRWQTHSVGRTVGFDPARRHLSGSPAERQGVFGQFDEVGLIERRDDGVEVELEQREQGVVGDASGRYGGRRTNPGPCPKMTNLGATRHAASADPVIRNPSAGGVLRVRCNASAGGVLRGRSGSEAGRKTGMYARAAGFAATPSDRIGRCPASVLRDAIPRPARRERCPIDSHPMRDQQKIGSSPALSGAWHGCAVVVERVNND